MPSPPAIAFPRLPTAKTPRLSPDTESLPEAAPLRSAFAAAAASFADARDEVRSAAVAALDVAVRAYVARCKAAGMTSEQVLIRVSDVTRRHAPGPLRPAHAAALRDVVFCAFLIAFYGDGRVRGPAAARLMRTGGQDAPRRSPTRGWSPPVRRDSRTRRP